MVDVVGVIAKASLLLLWLLAHLGLSARACLSVWPGSVTAWCLGPESEAGCGSSLFLKAWGPKLVCHLILTCYWLVSEPRFERGHRAPPLRGKCVKEFEGHFIKWKHCYWSLKCVTWILWILTTLKTILQMRNRAQRKQATCSGSHNTPAPTPVCLAATI